MNMQEYALEIFHAFKRRDAKKLRKLDSSLIKDINLNESKKIFYLAVLSYVLSKILSKPRFFEKRFLNKLEEIEKSLKKMAECKKECSDEEFEELVKNVEDKIKNLEAEDPRFVISLLTKGRLKVAATLYAQGFSLGMAASLANVEKQEILSYAGQTMMFDRLKEEKSVHERLKIVKSLIK